MEFAGPKRWYSNQSAGRLILIEDKRMVGIIGAGVVWRKPLLPMLDHWYAMMSNKNLLLEGSACRFWEVRKSVVSLA